MIDYLLLVPVALSFLTTLLVMPYWIKKARQIGLIWDDMNKLGKQGVAGSGGIIVVMGFIVGIIFYVAYLVFYLGSESLFLVEIFAMLNVVLILAGIGFIDDLLGWQRGGLSRRSRIILTGLASIPLISINAGKSLVSIPLIGVIELGLVYPLILIPIGIIGATTTFNFLAGFNGLESGQGVILLLSIGIVGYLTGNSWILIVSLCMVGSLLAFILFNYYPAKVFPGDSITYSIGGLVAILAILGNFEKIAVFFFIPYIMETVLKSRGKLKKHSFGEPQKDGSLNLKYNKIYGLTHLSIFLMKKFGLKVTEKKVVYSIWLFQTVVVILGFLIFREGIF